MPNRLFFLKKINHSLNLATLHNSKAAIIYINIDNFKDLNTILDYNIGNVILVLFSQSIIRIVGDHSQLEKIREDEFAILINKFSTIKNVKKICSEIHRYFQKPFKVMDYEIYIKVNMGISIFPEHALDGCELLRYSYFAMNSSKKDGKRPYAFFNKEIFDIYCRKISIDNELKNSVLNNELEIYYQPQVDTLRNEVVGVEALLRWNNKKLGSVSPEEFIFSII